MLATRISANLGSLQAVVESALNEMASTRVVARLWAKDHTLWKPGPAEIENRLGWLRVAEQMREQVGTLRAFVQTVRHARFRHVVLLGMGGSSLGPEVLRCTFGSARGYPRLWVLDSTVPGAVREVTQSIHPARTLFILASKSGGTIEVLSLFSHFGRLVARARGNTGGAQFIAITDPDTGLVSMARERRFRATFLNPPDIGGRYSVLSYFGLVPAALLGLDLKTLIDRGIEMAEACRPTVLLENNPGACLGAAMGMLGRAGRDKVTVITSPKVTSFGVWVEQLLAESTGKEGRGLIPIAGEPMGAPSVYGKDRLFVYLRLDGDANAKGDRHVKALERAGQPVIGLRLRDRYDLAAQFFLWEFATAVAGYFLSINPFDQPNVQESKENTNRILEEVRAQGRLPREPGTSRDSALAGLIAKAAPGRYLAILAYMKPSRQADAAIMALRQSVLVRHYLPTTAGYGPRYLHSTGQLHKGGPNTGLFLQLIERMIPDMKVPGAPYTFGTLAQAQAVGDLQSLQRHERSVVGLRLGRQPASTIRALARAPRERGSTQRRRSHGKRKTRTGTRRAR